MGIFNKKQSINEKPLRQEYLFVVDRWDQFLQKIIQRFEQALLQAEEVLLTNINQSDKDLDTTMQAWQGIKSQLMDLVNKTDVVFEEQVKPEMLQYVEHWQIIDQSVKGSDIRNDLYRKIDRFQIEIEGKIAEAFYQHTIQELDKDFYCTQCGAELQVRKDIFRTHYVGCSYCETVNTFTPNEQVLQLRWVVERIAKYKALPQWEAMQSVIEAQKQLPSPRTGEEKEKNIKLFNKREKAERTFWTTYYTIRSQYLPEYKDTIAYDVDVKMRWFYDERKRVLDY